MRRGRPDDALLNRMLSHFYRFAGRGNNPYGNNRPESGFVDNGKNGNLAFAMAAAASLTPDGEKSVYAGARDAAAMTSFYTTTFMLHGHTGGGIGEIWRSAAMGLLHDKKPNQYREFMDNRQWHYELSRRFDGSFGILGGARYDNIEWGAGYALSLHHPAQDAAHHRRAAVEVLEAIPAPRAPVGNGGRRRLRLDRSPPPSPTASVPDFSGETLAANASTAMNEKLGGGNVDAETMIGAICIIRIT